MNPAKVPWACSGLCRQVAQEVAARHGPAAHAAQMGGGHLAVDQLNVPPGALSGQPHQGDLRGIVAATEHGLSTEHLSAANAVEATGQFSAGPHLDAGCDT